MPPTVPQTALAQLKSILFLKHLKAVCSALTYGVYLTRSLCCLSSFLEYQCFTTEFQKMLLRGCIF